MIRKLLKYGKRKELTSFQRSQNERKGIQQHEFVYYYLIPKEHYLFPLVCRHRFLDRFCNAEKVVESIKDVIEEAINDGYINIISGQHISNRNIWVTTEGKRFMRWPNFFEAVLRGYSNCTLIVFSIIGTGIVGTLFAHWGIWDTWTSLLSRLF